MTLLNTILLFLTFLGGTPDHYPIPPQKANHLFYIQRTHNKNTIVYEANFDAKGDLKADDPVKIYWIMYEKKGNIESLNSMERKFAYGVTCTSIENHPHEYYLKLVSFDDLSLRLKQTEPYKAVVYREDKKKGESSETMDHIFVTANNSGLWTKVKSLEIFTKKSDDGSLSHETIDVD